MSLLINPSEKSQWVPPVRDRLEGLAGGAWLLYKYSAPRTSPYESVALRRAGVLAGMGRWWEGSWPAGNVIPPLFPCFHLVPVLKIFNANTPKGILTIIIPILTTLVGLFLPCFGLWPKIPGRNFINRLSNYSLSFSSPTPFSPSLLPPSPLHSSLPLYCSSILLSFIHNLPSILCHQFVILNSCTVNFYLRYSVRNIKNHLLSLEILALSGASVFTKHSFLACLLNSKMQLPLRKS